MMTVNIIIVRKIGQGNVTPSLDSKVIFYCNKLMI